MTFYRLYSFYRRSGAGCLHATRRALRSLNTWNN